MGFNLFANIAAVLFFQLASSQNLSLDLHGFYDDQYGLLGDYNAITSYSYVGESNFTNQNQYKNELFASGLASGVHAALGKVQGSISAIWPVHDDAFLLLGTFTSIGDTQLSPPVLYNLTNNSFTSIGSGLTVGQAPTTALVDAENNLIYLGGELSLNNSSPNFVIYNMTSAQLEPPKFKGFNGPVSSILKVDDNLVITGNFTKLELPMLTNSTNSSNTSVETEQLVSLKYATLSASNGQALGSSLSCAGSDPWKVGSTVGTLNINLPFQIMPSKFRIFNSADAQASLFRVFTAPTNGIMNLTYVDPQTNELAFCDAWCPLFNSSYLDQFSGSTSLSYNDGSLAVTSEYQDFGFVNSVEVQDVILEVLGSYNNKNFAIDNFQIYQSSFATYANNSLNEPACDYIQSYSNSATIGDGTWATSGSYMSTTLTDFSPKSLPEVGIEYYPNITYPGEYTMLLYTPGCVGDNSCAKRAVTNVTVIDSVTDEVLNTLIIFQNNNEEKYDMVYSGNLTNSVKVEMSLYQLIPGNSQSEIVLVADKLLTNMVSVDADADNNSTTTGLNLNGVFEYSPANFTGFDSNNVTGVVGNTTLNQFSSILSTKSDTKGISAVYFNNSIVFGGSFDSKYGSNLIKFDLSGFDKNSNAITGAFASFDSTNGTNGEVSGLNSVDQMLLISGNFTQLDKSVEISSLVDDSKVDEFNQLALYNGSWFTSDSGFITNLTLVGNQFLVFDDFNYDYSGQQVYNNSNVLSFNVSAAGANNDVSLFVGELKQSDYSSVGSNFITSDAIGSNITNTSATTVGLFVNDTFSVFASDESLVILNDNKTTTFNMSLDSNVLSLFSYRDKLFIGTDQGGEIDNEQFNGLAIYNTALNSFTTESLKKSAAPVKVENFGILNSTYLILGGQFDSVESDGDDVLCSGLCFYDLNTSEWTSLMNDFNGTVNHFRFVNETVLVGGGVVTLNGNSLNLFQYDFNSLSKEQTQPENFQELSGKTITKFLLVDNSTTGRIVIAGSNFVSAYDGSSWVAIDSELYNSSVSDIELMQCEEPNSLYNGDYFDNDQVLMASGEFNLDYYGYCNVAYFNGTNWVPYLIVTKDDSVSKVDSIYMNKDMSPLYISGPISSTSSNNSSNSTTTPTKPSHTSHPSNLNKSTKGNKVRRGFIVLIALALAVGTMGLLGLIGAFILFKRNKHDYQPLQPRVNETEMLETVPPQDLLKHV